MSSDIFPIFKKIFQPDGLYRIPTPHPQDWKYSKCKEEIFTLLENSPIHRMIPHPYVMSARLAANM